VALFFFVARDVHFMLSVICECHEEGEAKWREEVQESEGRRSNMDELYLTYSGRLSLLTSLNSPPCLKFVFCAFKVTIGLVRSYVTLAIALLFNTSCGV
jgi:hypothetical protein